MSVVKSKRKETPFKVITNFMELRRTATMLIYDKFKYKAKDGDDVCFYDWFIKMEQTKMFQLLQDADRFMIMANSIYPAFSHEYEQRRELQNAALGLCFDILQELQYIIEILKVDINKYAQLVSLVNDQVQLIRGWRQADNGKRKALLQKEQGSIDSGQHL